MKRERILFGLSLTVFAMAGPVGSVEVVMPDDLQRGQVRLRSPEDQVRTLGKVAEVLDLNALHDTLFELKIRRAGLKLEDGRPLTAFAWHEGSGLILGAGDPIRYVSVAGVEDTPSGQMITALFHNDRNEVVAPGEGEIRVFDKNFQPVKHSAGSVASVLPVNVLIDTSGSMSGAISAVTSATRTFLKKLPRITRCRLWTFDNRVESLTPLETEQLRSCPQSAGYLEQGLSLGGATALYEAIGIGITDNQGGALAEKNPADSVWAAPGLVIAVTDGVNTAQTDLTREALIDLKRAYNAKLFVFWAGRSDPGHLAGLSDWELSGEADIGPALQKFFGTIGVSVEGLQRILVP